MLNKQTIAIPFAQGLDSKTDPFQIPIGKLSELENAVFTQAGAINKRHGYTALNKNVGNSAAGPIQHALASGQYNNELLIFDGRSVYSYSDATHNWTVRGSMTSVNTTLTNIIRNEYTQTQPDANIQGNLECFAWEDSRGGVYYSIRDHLTGSFLVNEVLCRAGALCPKVMVFKGQFVIIYKYFVYDAFGVVVSGSIQCASINAATPGQFVTNVLVGDIGARLESQFDAMNLIVSGAERLYLAYPMNGIFDDGRACVTFYTDTSYTPAITYQANVLCVQGMALCLGPDQGSIICCVVDRSNEHDIGFFWLTRELHEIDPYALLYTEAVCYNKTLILRKKNIIRIFCGE